jgi:4-hydroxyphenylpyruvate dioxygenase-like putative hemolysin
MADYRVYYHPGAQLPRVVVKEGKEQGIAIHVDSIANFLMVRGLSLSIEGSPYSVFRRCLITKENDALVWVVERRGSWTMEPVTSSSASLVSYLQAVQNWKTRPRALENEDMAMKKALVLTQELVQLVGRNLAAWIVLEVEREYWQSRNVAGQIQKNRQDRLGMGWANHDHHTFRSSRRHFHQLVRLFEVLGFHCRERFYAGAEAGWGAQVMENPECKLILFLDVDLAAEEMAGDFAHTPLAELPQLGTIGLWCGLHGDSILKAGMHHLEAQFMFEELTEDLAQKGIQMMNPFSSFPYLKQAFTVGETWPVEPARIERLLREHKINSEQADKFLKQGALGSHLENLQRREGYKGFNQKNVSLIIKKTDPRSSS